MQRKKEMFAQYSADSSDDKADAEGVCVCFVHVFFVLCYMRAQAQNTINMWACVTGRESELALQLKNLLQCCEGDVEDQFRVFGMLEHYLKRPPLLPAHCCFQLSRQQQFSLVQGYYSFDPRFVRELLGLKLTNLLRKEILEISNRTALNFTACLRQFENLRRVLRARLAKEGEEVCGVVC